MTHQCKNSVQFLIGLTVFKNNCDKSELKSVPLYVSECDLCVIRDTKWLKSETSRAEWAGFVYRSQLFYEIVSPMAALIIVICDCK